MRLVIIVVVAMGILLPGTAHAQKQRFVKLILEERTTLDVGQFAVLTIPSKRRYTVSTAGDVLLPVPNKRKGRVVYRAVGPGPDTIVVTPIDMPAGGCVSCATRHYFVTVSSPDERKAKTRPFWANDEPSLNINSGSGASLFRLSSQAD
jgi:hypothetical protein